MAKKDYYETLGVSRTASEEEIKKAYKAKCFEYHPDRFATETPEKQKEMEGKFKEVQEAHNSIINGNADTEESGGFDNFFTNLYNSFKKQQKPNEPQIFNVQVENPIILSFKEAIAGCVKFVEFDFNCYCFICLGSGTVPTKQKCTTCKGRGSIMKTTEERFGVFKLETTCDSCGGSGKQNEKCKSCNGSGENVIKFKENLTFEPNTPVSKQVEKTVVGAKINFLIKVQTQLPDGFHVEVKNNKQVLIKTIEVPVIDYMIGSSIKLNLQDGQEDIEIHYGLNNNIIIFENKGVPHKGKRGPLEIHIKQTFPKEISEKQKELLNKFKES